MRTFWIADPMPPLQVGSPLKWGSSEWAADSCLAEWSEFERDWSGEPAPKRPHRLGSKLAQVSAPERSRARTSAPKTAPAPPPPFLVACFGLFAIGLGAFAWSVFLTLSA